LKFNKKSQIILNYFKTKRKITFKSQKNSLTALEKTKREIYTILIVQALVLNLKRRFVYEENA